MQFAFAYSKSSSIQNTLTDTQVSFAPDLKRQPTFFRGKLGKVVPFREAISTLHSVVVSDLRYKVKDRTAYKQWLAQQELIDWAEVGAKKSSITAKLKELQTEYNELITRSQKRLAPFYEARAKYFQYLYKANYEAWFVLDPVITVHPDQIFFECFSQDESSYGCLSARYDVFEKINEFECGTTNIDFSIRLYNEMQKMRSYRSTYFEVDPSGFQVQTQGESIYKEKKIDLPNSWVRGFLQVQSAMSLPTTSFDISPVDLYNICLFMRRNRERESPRALRYELTPNAPVKIIFEPWEYTLICYGSIYKGNEPQVIRTWGRRRLHIMERLIPIAKKVTIHLLGRGLPSFYVVDIGDMIFTLGLSGWTANDWSGESNFDLMVSRQKVEWNQLSRVFAFLKDKKFASADEIAYHLEMDKGIVLSALGLWCQSGKVMYDLYKGVYRLRELTQDDLPLEDIVYRNEREISAGKFLNSNAVTLTSTKEIEGKKVQVAGSVKDKTHTYTPSLTIDADQRVVKAECTCYWHKSNKLQKGPCEHIIAVRAIYDKTEREKKVRQTSITVQTSEQKQQPSQDVKAESKSKNDTEKPLVNSDSCKNAKEG